ncbi:MAG: hypothetical protein U9N32_00250 [Spirochaetota bacterium]|nr:hypothetical protein [Spirochaetota bacterium]
MQFLSKNNLTKIKIWAFAIVLINTQSFADCKITKHTYEVVSEHAVCTYTSYWRESRSSEGLYRAEGYNLQLSPECASFPKPLKGKKIKKEFVRNIVGSDCPFEETIK